MKKPEIAEIVAGALKHFDGERYHLHAWCVMPNHVHAIVEVARDKVASASRSGITLKKTARDGLATTTQLTVENSDFTKAMSASVKDSTSPVNLLIGYKKFVEGWDCWRVSTMGMRCTWSAPKAPRLSKGRHGMVIDRISKIKNHRIFCGFAWTQDLLDFKKNNLFYGWNETGYQINHNGTIAKNLREGEKTAIAFLYFLKSPGDKSFSLKKVGSLLLMIRFSVWIATLFSTPSYT